jgi:2'-5' RNA ligase
MEDRGVAAPAGSALIIPLLAVERIVGIWRRALDPSAADGVPAHVTIHFPWVAEGLVHQIVLRDLQAMAAATLRFEVAFPRVGWFDREVLWLDPDPKEPFVALAADSARRWPDYPQFEGRFETVVPHVTVGIGMPDRLEAVAARLREALPINDAVTQLWWITRSEPEPWVVRRALDLG